MQFERNLGIKVIMRKRIKLFEIKMFRDNLENIPTFALPDEYSVKWYEKGDEKLWLQIHTEAEKDVETSLERFKSEFGSDSDLLAQRQLFLLDSGQNPIGTVTAWFGDFEGELIGRIHWLAVVPGKQGQGLAKALTTIACNRLHQLGHKKVFLTTHPVKTPAVNLYLKFGFVPVIENTEDLHIWQKLQKKLKTPFDLEGL